jgi:hypothetical protein
MIGYYEKIDFCDFIIVRIFFVIIKFRSMNKYWVSGKFYKFKGKSFPLQGYMFD